MKLILLKCSIVINVEHKIYLNKYLPITFIIELKHIIFGTF